MQRRRRLVKITEEPDAKKHKESQGRDQLPAEEEDQPQDKEDDQQEIPQKEQTNPGEVEIFIRYCKFDNYFRLN